jgi:hypothetical protein
MEKHKKIISKIWAGLLTAYKIAVALNGVAAVTPATTNPISVIIAGSGVIASAVSAMLKDGKVKPLMAVVNIMACNLGYAANDAADNKWRK